MSLTNLIAYYKHLASQHDQSKHSSGKGFFKGDFQNASMREVYEGSSSDVQMLARTTGILAVDKTSYDYTKEKYDTGELRLGKSQASFTYDQVHTQLRKAGKRGYSSLVVKEPDKSFNDLSAKYMDTGSNRQRNARTSIDPLKTELAAIKRGSSFDSQGLSAFSDKEKKLFTTLSNAYSPKKGTVPHDVLNSLPEDDLLTLHGMAHKVNARNAVVDNIVEVRTNYIEQKGIIIQDMVSNSRKRHEELQALWDGQIYLEDEVDRIVGHEIPSIKPDETLTNYVDRITKSEQFQKTLPETPLPPPLPPNFDTMIGLSTIPKIDIQKRMDNSWDHGNHSDFQVTVNHAFKIKHPVPIQEKWETARRKHGNVQSGMYHGTDYAAGRGINSTGFRVSLEDVKAGRMLGDGVYLSNTSSKTVQYIGESYGRDRADGVIMELDAALDSTTDWTQNETWYDDFSQGNVNSVHAPKGKQGFTKNGLGAKYERSIVNDEWAVKDPAAVIPTLWLDVTRDTNY